MRTEHNRNRALRPDAQAFDEVRITTVPRYKTSGLSGDEWRISAKIELFRKGRLVAHRYAGNVQAATAVLPGFFLESVDNGFGYFAGEGDFCDQEGCSDTATVTYRLKRIYSRDNPSEWNREVLAGHELRRFCERHARRGDCGFDDADDNYERVDQ